MAQILIIDDEEIVRRSLRIMLEQQGHRVIEAEDGIEGIDLFRASEPDLLIIDIFMPEKDGLEIIREIREENEEVKIMAITGGGTSGDLDFLPQALAFGAQGTLHKPFLQNELFKEINRILTE